MLPRILVFLVLAAALSVPTGAAAVVVERAADIPTDIGGSTVLPNQIATSADGSTSVAATLPAGFRVGAFERLPNGRFWIVPALPASSLCGSEYGPTDVVEWDGTSCSLPFGGAMPAFPPGTRIDALLVESSRPVVSFDQTVTLDGTTFQPSDLVMVVGSPVLWWSGAAAGIPVGSNLVGASRDADGAVAATFDVPTTIGASTFLPGQLVRWNGSTATLAWGDPAWPAGSILRDFSLGPHSGHVPDGHLRPGEPLRLVKNGGGIDLAWGAGCSAADVDYAVYEGAIGAFASHVPNLCSSSGALGVTVSPTADDRYFLVAPRSFLAEGSHGLAGSGAERPRGPAPCVPQDLATPCP